MLRHLLILLLVGWASGMARAEGDAHIVQKFDGVDVNVATAAFIVKDQWEVAWFSPRPISFTILTADGHPVAGSHGAGKGTLYVARGGNYYIQINSDHPEMKAPWQMVVAEIATGTHLNAPGLMPMLSMPAEGGYAPLTSALPPGTGATTNPSGMPMAGGMPGAPQPAALLTPAGAPPDAAPPAPVPGGTFPTASGDKLTDDQARAVVLIKGDKAEGTGFMVKSPEGPVVITNIHVIANNPNLKITTNTGAFVTVVSEKCASDRDLAMLAIQDKGYSYLQMAPDISAVVQPGDPVITPGNSQGGEVMLNTSGTVLGVGPERVEISNPIYHGNSGGPVFHVKSGKVLGVVTEAEKVDLSSDLDKASFASRNSAIAASMRYFALRLDTVSEWVSVDPAAFAIETKFLDQFEDQSRRLDSYLNASDNSGNPNGASDQSAKLYLDDEKIMRAEQSYQSSANGGDTSQHIEALRSLLFDLQGVADINVTQIQSMNNFYPFDRDRARDEMAYRKALKDELDNFGSHIERLGHMPRTNN